MAEDSGAAVYCTKMINYGLTSSQSVSNIIVTSPGSGGTCTLGFAGSNSDREAYSSSIVVYRRSGATDNDMHFNVGGNDRLIIDDDGTLTGTDTDGISAISDERLKKNITPYTEGLDALVKLEPKNWEWKNPQYHDGEQNYGIVAQDLEKVKGNDKVLNKFYREKELVVDEDGEVTDKEYDLLKDDGKKRSVKFSTKDAMYISAIKTLLERIEVLESKIK